VLQFHGKPASVVSQPVYSYSSLLQASQLARAITALQPFQNITANSSQHEVIPLGTFRYALTCRTIDLASLLPAERPAYPVKPDTGIYTPAYTAPTGSVVPEWWQVPAVAGPASSVQ
jgi:hypothetical protein